MFVAPEVKQLINSIDFPDMLSKVEQTAWASFVFVVNRFLGKHKAENYREVVDGLVETHHKMCCSVSLKVNVLRAHLDKLEDNMIDYPEEQGERFHQMSGLSRNTITDSTMKLWWGITHEIF